jgi:hypothetical protein
MIARFNLFRYNKVLFPRFLYKNFARSTVLYRSTLKKQGGEDDANKILYQRVILQ